MVLLLALEAILGFLEGDEVYELSMLHIASPLPIDCLLIHRYNSLGGHTSFASPLALCFDIAL
jgi:hypothetical protein